MLATTHSTHEAYQAFAADVNFVADINKSYPKQLWL